MKTIKQFDLNVKDLEKDTFPSKGIFIPESDYGLATISLDDTGMYCLFEIPMYGGEPIPYKPIETAQEVVDTIQSWT